MVQRIFRKKPLTFVSTVALFVLLIILGLYFLPMNLPTRVSYADSLLKKIYADDNRVHLSDDVTIFQVQDALGVTNRLTGEVKDTYGREAQEAYEKYRNLSKVMALTNVTKEDLENGHIENVTIKKDLDEKTWEFNKDLIAWTDQDSFTNNIDNVYVKANQQWSNLKLVEDNLKLLPNELPQEEGQLTEDLDFFLEVGNELSTIEALPQQDLLEASYTEKVDAYLEAMQVRQEVKPINEEVLQNLYTNDYFLEKVQDGPLDVRPRVALTFDDGPNEDFTPQVLDLLDKYGVKGTFFMVGREVEHYPHIAQEVLDRGHEIGNHSYSHSSFLDMNDSGVLWEIDTTNEIIENNTGYQPKYYRMPFGSGGKRVYDLVDSVESIMWNVDTYDWGLNSAEEIMEWTAPILDKEIIVLMHDTSQKSVDGLELLLEELVKQHYVFVGVGDIKYDEKYREH